LLIERLSNQKRDWLETPIYITALRTKSQALYIMRPLKKRCRILPAGGLGVSPSYKSPPKIGGYRGLIESISAV
jgi:hypothetical protein